MKHFFQRKSTRNAIYQSNHIASKAHLELSMFIELIEYYLRNRILFQVDNDIDTMTIGAVMNIGNFRKFFIPN